jgi:hypothetical protein
MSTILQKIKFKDQSPVLVLNAPAEFAEGLAALKKISELHTAVDKKTDYAFALVFVTTPADVKKIGGPVVARLADDAPLWFGFPKKTSKKYRGGINRDEGWAPLGEKGLEPVSLVAMDDDWSILRFRQVAKIKKMIRRSGMTLSAEGKAKTINKTNKAIRK